MMKRFLRMALVVLILLVAGFVGFIRFAPSIPDRWNVAISRDTIAETGSCAAAMITERNGAYAACLSPMPPAALLTQIDTIAMTTPRTTRLAGTPGEGRITWITRTPLMGFPDYTTAEAIETPSGTRLDIYARQRFGSGDRGVNAARLKDWLSRL